MNSHERIQLLERLLERVRRNAQASRIPAGAVIMTEPTSASPTDAEVIEAVADEDWSDIEALASGPVSAESAAELDLELLEEDIIEITEEQPAVAPEAELEEVAPPPAEPAVAFDATELALEEQEEEELPVSSRRPKVAAASMDEALASAAQHMQLGEPGEVEVPIKTPPPESGRQVAGPSPAQLEAPAVPELDESVEAQAAPVEQPPAAAAFGPTPEQLGQTVELEEAEGPELELAPPIEVPAIPAPADELEAPLVAVEAPGKYDEALVLPSEAREELERHREKETVPAPKELAALAPAPPTPAEPEITRRPAIPAAAPVAAFSSEALVFEPTTFVQLLDASLGL